MQERGRVVEAGNGRAVVEVAASGGCGHCSARSLCNWTGTSTRQLLARDEVGVRPGEQVLLEHPVRVGSNLLVFGVPALGLLTGILFGGLFFSDPWAAVLGGIGLLVGVGVVKFLDRAANRSGRILPVVVRRVESDGGENCESSDDSAGSAASGRLSAGATDAADQSGAQ